MRIIGSLMVGLAGVALAGCVGGASHVDPAYTQATSAAPPFVGSVFAQCTVFVTDSGRAGRSVPQPELQASPDSIGACPHFLLLANPSNDDAQTSATQRSVFYLTMTAPGTCTYAPLLSTDVFATCKLAA